MNVEEFREYCLSLPDVSEATPFEKFSKGKFTILVFYVNSHMFCYFNVDDFSNITIKCESSEMVELKEHYQAVGEPFNGDKRYWISVQPNMDFSDENLKELVRKSYEIVKAKTRSMDEMWNLWHGCHKKSEGCQHCYVFRRDAEFEKDSNVVTKTSSFNLPIRRDRSGNWKVPSGTLMWTCFTSDFFIEEADQWREDAWLMIHRRSDLHFFMITKRPERILQCLPEDWGDGYENVTICCTMENQRRVDERLPIYRELPIRHKSIICEPLLESIDFHGGLGSWCEQVTVGGESGSEARVCDYAWVLGLREQCIAANVPFHFKQTGAHFRKDGRLYNIPRNQQMKQAHRAAIDYNTNQKEPPDNA